MKIVQIIIKSMQPKSKILKEGVNLSENKVV